MSSLTKYDGEFLVPISTVTINTTMPANVDGECVRPTYNIDMNGYLIWNAGSPTSSGTFGNYTAEQCETLDSDERLNALLGKHCALVQLFSENYKELELGTVSGSPNLTAYPRVLSMSLTDTSNPSFWTYSVSLEAPDLFCNGVSISPTGCGCIKSFEESWDISYSDSEFLSEYGENRLFNVSHQISAIGVGVADSSGLTTSPYECALDFVCARKGVNATIPNVCVSGFNSSGVLYNYNESHNIDKPNGAYSLSETWLICDTPYIESYSVEVQESADTSCATVSIQGTIRGFDIRASSGIVPSGVSRYAHANARWNELESESGIYVRATGDSGIGSGLWEIPINGTVAKNKYNGEISYNRSYRNRQFKFLPSAKSENISYGTNWNEDSFATIQLLSGGQILHPLNYDSSGIVRGKNLTKTTLSISAVYPCGTGIGRKGPRFTAPYSGEINDVVSFYNPTGDIENWFTVVESQSENWVPADGSYSYNINFVSQPTGNCQLFF